MVRMLISLLPEEKSWIDAYSRRHSQSLAETVRQALRQMKKSSARATVSGQAFSSAFALWKSRRKDGLSYVAGLRKEWDR